MMPKEGMVWFIVDFLITRIYGLVKKSSLYLNYWGNYDNFIDSIAAIVFFSLWKNLLRMTAIHLPKYYYVRGAIHAQSKEKDTFIGKKGYPHDFRHTLILQTKILENTLCHDISRDPKKG